MVIFVSKMYKSEKKHDLVRAQCISIIKCRACTHARTHVCVSDNIAHSAILIVFYVGHTQPYLVIALQACM